MRGVVDVQPAAAADGAVHEGGVDVGGGKAVVGVGRVGGGQDVQVIAIVVDGIGPMDRTVRPLGAEQQRRAGNAEAAHADGQLAAAIQVHVQVAALGREAARAGPLHEGRLGAQHADEVARRLQDAAAEVQVAVGGEPGALIRPQHAALQLGLAGIGGQAADDDQAAADLHDRAVARRQLGAGIVLALGVVGDQRGRVHPADELDPVAGAGVEDDGGAVHREDVGAGIVAHRAAIGAVAAEGVVADEPGIAGDGQRAAFTHEDRATQRRTATATAIIRGDQGQPGARAAGATAPAGAAAATRRADDVGRGAAIAARATASAEAADATGAAAAAEAVMRRAAAIRAMAAIAAGAAAGTEGAVAAIAAGAAVTAIAHRAGGAGSLPDAQLGRGRRHVHGGIDDVDDRRGGLGQVARAARQREGIAAIAGRHRGGRAQVQQRGGQRQAGLHRGLDQRRVGAPAFLAGAARTADAAGLHVGGAVGAVEADGARHAVAAAVTELDEVVVDLRAVGARRGLGGGQPVQATTRQQTGGAAIAAPDRVADEGDVVQRQAGALVDEERAAQAGTAAAAIATARHVVGHDRVADGGRPGQQHVAGLGAAAVQRAGQAFAAVQNGRLGLRRQGRAQHQHGGDRGQQPALALVVLLRPRLAVAVLLHDSASSKAMNG